VAKAETASATVKWTKYKGAGLGFDNALLRAKGQMVMMNRLELPQLRKGQLSGTCLQGASTTGPDLTTTEVTGNSSTNCPSTGWKTENSPTHLPAMPSDSHGQQEVLLPQSNPSRRSRPCNRLEICVSGGPKVTNCAQIALCLWNYFIPSLPAVVVWRVYR